MVVPRSRSHFRLRSTFHVLFCVLRLPHTFYVYSSLRLRSHLLHFTLFRFSSPVPFPTHLPATFGLASSLFPRHFPPRHFTHFTVPFLPRSTPRLRFVYFPFADFARCLRSPHFLPPFTGFSQFTPRSVSPHVPHVPASSFTGYILRSRIPQFLLHTHVFLFTLQFHTFCYVYSSTPPTFTPSPRWFTFYQFLVPTGSSRCHVRRLHFAHAHTGCSLFVAFAFAFCLRSFCYTTTAHSHTTPRLHGFTFLFAGLLFPFLHLHTPHTTFTFTFCLHVPASLRSLTG